MELTLPAAALSRELSLMQGVVEKRATHQILTNVLLEARDSILSSDGDRSRHDVRVGGRVAFL